MIQTPTQEEFNSFFTGLSASHKQSILSITSGFSDSYVPLCMRGTIPKPLNELYNHEYVGLSYPELLTTCEAVFQNYSITGEMAANVEKHTRDHFRSKVWYQQCAGHVTASKLKAAVCTNMNQPSVSLIRSVCYPESSCFKSAATCWGCEHEKTALAAYHSQGRKKHVNFLISESGLVIHPTYPFMGASPDSFVECECCGKRVIEVKCPYSCKHKSIDERSEESQFVLKKDEKGDLCLDTYHAYYFQVQAQLKFCSASYADFVVWTDKQLFIQRVYPDV